MQVAAFLVLGILRIRCILWKEYECLRIHNKYIQVYMNFRQGWIRISSQGSEILPECIETNPICYQILNEKGRSSLAKKKSAKSCEPCQKLLIIQSTEARNVLSIQFFFVPVKLVLCAIEVSRSLHSVYSCSSWNFDRMKLGLGTGMPNPK